MKKILLLSAVCTLTTVNAARPFTILNDTENYLVYGHLTAKNTLNCNDYLVIYDLEMYPGDWTTADNNNLMLTNASNLSFSREVYHNSTLVIPSNFRNKSTELFVNGTFEWSNFNFKTMHQSNPMLQDGTVLSFITGQACDNSLPHQWTGGNGTSIARGGAFSIGEHMYITFSEQ
ncbi:MAG: hypothetical protein KIG88_11545 [Weeksellaceae bacterium]|nr:hypothetical protein [Weeksellaceae bacterium]